MKKLLREIKKDLNKQEDNPYPQTGRFNIVEMSILNEAIYRINAITIKIIFWRNGKANPQIHITLQ